MSARKVQNFAKGDLIFEQESPSKAFHAITGGRVKIYEMMPCDIGEWPRVL